ncbi:MAG: helicase-associated domain-containing protein [Anaerolineales bacterium]|jgi:hypothetical protein
MACSSVKSMGMQALLQTLQDHDLGHLKIVAELWGFEPPTGNALQAAEKLALSMLDPQTVSEIYQSLLPAESQILDLLILRGGRVPLGDLTRRSGPLRRMGPGKRDREKPWRNPASALEILWYRGLIATAFADSPTGPKEFVFIPSDLIPLLPPPTQVETAIHKPALESPSAVWSASDSMIEDATTLLAAMRRRPITEDGLSMQRRTALTGFLRQSDSLDLLFALLIEIDVLEGSPLQTDPSNTRAFLELPHRQALERLIRVWSDSSSWNDLAHIPTLIHAGKHWPNDPLATRRSVIGILNELSMATWYEIDSFVFSIRDRRPDFQRPGGDFDSWYLQDAGSGDFLQGFEHWNDIEGALLRYLLTGPLHWLGVVDLGAGAEDRFPSAFCLTPLAVALFDPDFTPQEIPPKAMPILVRPDGSITVPRQSPFPTRYQVSRFCAWLPPDESSYLFRLSPSSLGLAQDQGLSLQHIRTLLEEASGKPIPPRLLKALQRWRQHGQEAHFEESIVLRVAEAELLDQLLSHRATARFIIERLGPKAARLRPGDMRRLLAAASNFGLLIDPLSHEGEITP